jgi:exopolyphosphatase/guanosine-5'-triphosphate,3'-diphosphate pyrophosphatase
MPRAAIDIGSNSVLLTVMDDHDVVLHDEARVVGLGRGLGERGLFALDRIKAAEAALTDYVRIAQRLGVDPWAIEAVATSAARRAMNAQTWFSRVQRRLGLRVRVISGEEEARLTWKGALRELAVPPGPILVVDLGGGSTELVLGEADRVVQRVSLEIGSVRLTERFLGADLNVANPASVSDMRNFIGVEVGGIDLDPQPRTVIGVAGTVTTLAAMSQGMTTWNANRVHGSTLTRTDLARFVDMLLPMGPEQRRMAAQVSPERADYLLAGALVLDRVLSAARRPKLVASDRGLRFGLLAG